MSLIHIGAVVVGALCLAVSFSARASEQTPPVEVEASTTLAARTDAWHAQRLEALAAPDGWLSLVAFEWLKDGRNRVGSAPGSEVFYAGFPADHVATIVVRDGVIRLEDAAGVSLSGPPDDRILRTDADGSPTVLSLGEIRFYVVVRGGRLAVRIKDAASPTRADFRGIERYTVDEAWRITAQFVPATQGETVALDTVIGVREESAVSGRARFVHEGVEVDAVLLAAGDGGSLLRFGDETNGAGTYGAGRYLYVEPSLDGATVILDFNRAYNPPCAFTPFATCSIPPPSNRFPFPVAAGERWTTVD